MDMPTDLKNSIKNHERVESFLRNTCGKLAKLDLEYKKKYGKTTSKQTVQEIVEGLAGLFAGKVQAYHDEQHMSILEKMRLREEAERKAALDKAVTTGELTGDYAELNGVVKFNGNKKEENNIS